MESSRMTTPDPNIEAARRMLVAAEGTAAEGRHPVPVTTAGAALAIAYGVISIAGSLQQIAAALRKGDSA